MTDEEWESVPQKEINKVKRYVGKTLMPLMGIKWDIQVMSFYRPDCKAAVTCYPNIHAAELWIGDPWPTLDRDERRYCMVHEMVHVMAGEQDQFVMNAGTNPLPGKAKHMARHVYTNLTEQFTDRMATAIARYYPEFPI